MPVDGVIITPVKFLMRAGKIQFTFWPTLKKNIFIFQNILKRTTPGSRDEDTATKAFNELKKVVIITYNGWNTSIITSEA